MPYNRDRNGRKTSTAGRMSQWNRMETGKRRLCISIILVVGGCLLFCHLLSLFFLVWTQEKKKVPGDSTKTMGVSEVRNNVQKSPHPTKSANLVPQHDSRVTGKKEYPDRPWGAARGTHTITKARQ
ncbi:hypothetical protein BCR43DRAFT_484216 [Syncephalastrum racemosum]|uniref:Uncharacterized protein n=1 Tax=Syncephalastrum racemosum TaxID=13706 RepID=A0A1X2HWI8_SYNRA|nr:hypothetical protein BCR43DRAFT_484216 [Syncephalastrum racemosum]